MLFFSVNERVENIKGNEEEINRFVDEYKPFIASCAEKVTGRYMNYGKDDELSIALIAFVEAIKSYSSMKGNFLSFSQNVIKRRLIDYFRKEKKHSNLVPLYEYCGEDEEELDLSAGEALDKHSREEISEYRRLELEELKEELRQWDISFMELVTSSPKHEKTRKSYSFVIKFLLSQPDLVEQVKNKKVLPLAEIEKYLKIPRKTIERARKYIIAVLIVMTGDYQYIKGYVNWW